MPRLQGTGRAACRLRGLLLLLLLPACPSRTASDLEPLPPWAYPVPEPGYKATPDDGLPRHVPDSAASFSVAQTRDWFFAPDWHPEEHPPLPDVVAHGRKPDVYACAVCHRADGPGGPENASLAGLPAAYIVQQVADFASGVRRNPVPKRLPTTWMAKIAVSATPDEIAVAAEYFSALPPRANIRVVETDAVPETHVAGWVFADSRSGKTEPLGPRIIEVPENLEQFENRDARSRFVAYVPPGSIERGRALAADGGAGKTVPCGTCHGPELHGMGVIPRLAGRSPSYVIRQLLDFKQGARRGGGCTPMLPVVQHLTVDDMIALAAFVASRPP